MFTEDSISLVSGFLLFCLFGLGAFALSRFIGKYGKAFQKGRYMKVVDQIQIAQDRQLFILRLEKEIFRLFSVGRRKIEVKRS